MVRLISMAMTGYYRTMQRPRAHQPLSMLKYDPIGTPISMESHAKARKCLTFTSLQICDHLVDPYDEIQSNPGLMALDCTEV